MDKIKERAAEYAIAHREDWMPKDCYSSDLFDGYVKGANEQKKIDDAENGKALLYAVDKTTKRVRKEMVEKACEIIEQFCKGLEPHRRNFTIDDFRKAMEGNSGNKEEIPSKLTWQDVKEIVTIADNALGQFGSRSWLASEEAYYTEVLRRLNEKKED